ncbi:general odorant-binding protein 56a-like isoform X2 [Wyeomyia smithii]|uniref:general odorant-binding protein 56a-like isoform X2 n=1 Tax=Wyeomyia smithii TaxID=174621 RepID=UPI00246814FF|nr:general odorant-binding protein 56a-like isoform X2 [Wyeomyia smithii]
MGNIRQDILSLGVTDEEREAARQLAGRCMRETGTSEEAVQRLRNGDTSNADSNTKCFTQCFFQGAGFVDADGNVQEDHLVEKLSTQYDRSKAEEIVQRCKNNSGPSPCERSFILFECYVANRASLM